MSRRLRLAALLSALALAAACSATTNASDDPEPAGASASTPEGPAAAGAAGAADDAGHDGHGEDVAAPPPKPLRAGESFDTLAMPAAYTPSAPNGVGTDDYRCFLLDPKLVDDSFITGINVLPGNPGVVHHVILFRVPPDKVGVAQAKDAEEDGQGWTCFGGTGIEAGPELDDAPWLGAWAPGGGESVMAKDVGIPLEAGSRVIMQVHYNLLAGAEPDTTAAKLRMAPGSADLDALGTMLLPAPVELPCRPAHDDGPLCTRLAATLDVEKRFGPAGQTASLLHLLCGPVEPGPTQTCDRSINAPATIRSTAGHMHLLGRSIKIEVNPGTPRARTVLDIPVWDFDNQGAKPIKPVRLRTGDDVRVTCTHDQSFRDVLPAFEGQQERYVVWGEGTTDEMCLGMLLITRP